MTTTATLSPERTAALRAFLAHEAALDLAPAERAAARPRVTRRAVAGFAVAAALGGAAVVVANAAGGPGSSIVAPPAGAAVEVDAVGGWTTVHLVDAAADPTRVVRELRARGVDARLEHLDGVTTDGSGAPLLSSDALAGHEHDVFVLGVTGRRGLAGLSVPLPAGVSAPADGPEAPLDPDDAFHRSLVEHGVRVGADGSVSLRDDAGLTLHVLTAR